MNISLSNIKDESRKIPLLLFVGIVLYFLAEMRCWIGFGGKTLYLHLLMYAVVFYYFITKRTLFNIQSRYRKFALLFFVLQLYMTGFGITPVGLIMSVLNAFSLALILSIDDYRKEDLLQKIIGFYGLMTIIGLLLFIGLFYISLPNLGELEADYGNIVMIDKSFENYIFYLRPTTYSIYDLGTYRFNGPFIEPGDYACTAAFILYAAQFDFKRYRFLWAVLAGLIASMSLAGISMAALGYLMIKFGQNKVKARTVISVIVLFFAIFLYGAYYNGGDNYLGNSLFVRFTSDAEHGVGVDARASVNAIDMFSNMTNNIGTLLFGYSNITESMNVSGAGFIVNAVRFGFVGIFLLILPYYAFTRSSYKKKYAWMFFMLFIMYMYQRAESYWLCFMLTYVYGIVINEQNYLNDGKS